MKFKLKDLGNVPNILTIVRILCVPIFVWVAVDVRISAHHLIYAFFIFSFATITDIVDGTIARKCNLITDLGKILDPFADKLLQLSALLCLTYLGNVPLAITIIFLSKDIYLVLGSILAVYIAKEKVVLQSNIVGKIGTVVNAIGIVSAFFLTGDKNVLYYINRVLLYGGCVIALVIAVVYTVVIIKQVRSKSK